MSTAAIKLPVLLQRISIPLDGRIGDANIRRRHPAEAAAWLWHPECRRDELAILRFNLAAPQWNTGTPPWQVERLEHAVSFAPHGFTTYHVIGPRFAIDLDRWFHPTPAVLATAVEGPIDDNPYGIQRGHWRLHPTRLQEQQSGRGSTGIIRAWTEAPDEPFRPFQERTDAITAAWQGLVDGWPPPTWHSTVGALILE